MSKVVRGALLGEGQYGSVFQGSMDGQNVAVKRIKPHELRPGMNFTALREVRYLRTLKHDHVVRLLDTYISDRTLFLVMEFCPSDLEKLIRDKTIFLSPADVKAYCLMMLKAVAFCHSHAVLHRDIKPANLLLSEQGLIKLADFGLARSLASPGNALTHLVATRWYRAPELLFGATSYGFAPDVWSCGCVLGELLLRSPLFPGETDPNQLQKIFALLGTPSVADWPGLNTLPGFVLFEHCDPLTLEQWQQLFTGDSSSTTDLLLAMLVLNPSQRISALDALNHHYFVTHPSATKSSELRMPGSAKGTRD